MLSFQEWLAEAGKEELDEGKTLPPVKETGFWTDKFGEEKVDDASVEDLFSHAKKHPKGLLGGIRSLQLLASYGSFPKEKVKELWKKYNDTKK